MPRTEPIQEIVFVGREALLAKLMDWLERPDDVADFDARRTIFKSPPGYFGLAGMGKTRLLNEFLAKARKVTPYVVLIDFANTSQVVPAKPLPLMERVIEELSNTDRKQRSFFQRDDPFKNCLELLAEPLPAPQNASQKLNVYPEGTASGINWNLVAESPAAGQRLEELKKLFQTTLPHLHHKSKTRSDFNFQRKPFSRPLIVIALDAVELAPRAVREWLGQLPEFFGSKNHYEFHVIAVAMGRDPIKNLNEVELPPLDKAASETFIRNYLIDKWGNKRSLWPSDKLRAEIIEEARGVPLMLAWMTDLAVMQPNSSEFKPAALPDDHSTRFYYVLDRYLTVLEDTDPDLFNLILIGSVPRRIESSELLGALLQKRGAKTFDVAEAVRQFSILKKQGFVYVEDDGALRYHDLVREGALAYVREKMPKLSREANLVAAGWFKQKYDTADWLYHTLQVEPDEALSELTQVFETVLQNKDYAQVQRLLAATERIELPYFAQEKITLLKADLAYAEGDKTRALMRLRGLYQTQDKHIAEAVAQRLENWMGWNAETTTFSADVPDILFWSRYRGYKKIQAHALRGLGEARRMADDGKGAAGLYEQALKLYREIEDKRGEADALKGLGDARQMAADGKGAAGWYEQALKLYREIEDKRGEANALKGLGDARQMADDGKGAAGLYEQALKLYREIEDKRGEANALLGLGDARQMAADGKGAAGWYEQALTLYREMENKRGEANALLGLGEARRMAADGKGAAGLYEQALKLYREIEDKRGEADALKGLGDARQMADDGKGAAGLYEQALKLYREIEDKRGEANALKGLGDARQMAADGKGAAGWYEQALTLYREIENKLGEANALRRLGEARRMAADGKGAAGLYEQALTLYREIGNKRGEANALLGLGEARQMADDGKGAAGWYEQALTLYREIENKLGEANALRRLGEARRMMKDYDGAKNNYAQAFALYAQIQMSFEICHFAAFACDGLLSQNNLAPDGCELAIWLFSQTQKYCGNGPQESLWKTDLQRRLADKCGYVPPLTMEI